MVSQTLLGWMLVIVLPAGGVRAQSLEMGETPGPTKYYYRFESPTFQIEFAELEFDTQGGGTFVFRQRSEEETIKLDIHLRPETLHRIKALLTEANFLSTDEPYQGNRDLSHLGTTTIGVQQGSRERRVSFNYTRHPAMRELASLLRSIVTQETRVFAIDLARRYEPMDLDRQLVGLLREVRNGWVAEPRRLLPLLHEIEADDGLLLIARRRAREIIRLIDKR